MKRWVVLFIVLFISALASAKSHHRSHHVMTKWSPEIAATGNKVFIFDPRKLGWAAYDSNGQLVSSGRASGGRGYCPDVRRHCRTPVGHFRVYHKGPANCKSSKFPVGRGGAPMPYCMFFRGGYAIHGSPDVPRYNASHGCIRVPPQDARWLSHTFVTPGTSVIVRPY